MNKYVQTLSHTNQQKIRNITGKKKGGMKGKKIHHLALAHIMHAPHKACNFRFTESKGRGEKSKQWRVNGREKNQSRDRRVNGEKSKLRVKGEICKEWSKVRVKGGRNMQRREGG
jgi:hypothetical protein